jgi:ABC-type dipeptide/oligopeptide/nickel transport system permease component
VRSVAGVALQSVCAVCWLMSVIMITSVLIILSNLLADIVYGLLDPRIRYQ